MIDIDLHETPEKRYQAWIRNKFLVLSLTIQGNRPKEKSSLLKHEFILEEIEHHFMDSHAGNRIWRAFRYLKQYLKTYPHIEAKRRKPALIMLWFIYDRLGFDGSKLRSAEYECPVVAKNRNHEEAALAVSI